MPKQTGKEEPDLSEMRDDVIRHGRAYGLLLRCWTMGYGLIGIDAKPPEMRTLARATAISTIVLLFFLWQPNAKGIKTASMLTLMMPLLIVFLTEFMLAYRDVSLSERSILKAYAFIIVSLILCITSPAFYSFVPNIKDSIDCIFLNFSFRDVKYCFYGVPPNDLTLQVPQAGVGVPQTEIIFSIVVGSALLFIVDGLVNGYWRHYTLSVYGGAFVYVILINLLLLGGYTLVEVFAGIVN